MHPAFSLFFFFFLVYLTSPTLSSFLDFAVVSAICLAKMSAPTTYEGWMATAAELVKKVEETDDMDIEEATELVTEAAKAYEKAHQLKQDDVLALFQWGRAIFTLSEFVDEEEEGIEAKIDHVDNAIEKLEMALVRDSKDPDVLFHLAQANALKSDLLMDELDDTENARIYMERAIGYFDRAYPLREAQIKNGTPNLLGEVVGQDALIDIVSSAAEAVTSLALLQTDDKKAEALFQSSYDRLARALDLAPERRAELLNEWATALQSYADWKQDKLGHFDDTLYEPAIAKLEESIAVDPTRTESICDLAELHLNVAHTILARAALGNEDEEIEADNPEDEEKIRALIERAIEIDPTNATLHVKLADAIFGQSQLPIKSSRQNLQALLKLAEEGYRTALVCEKEVERTDILLRLAQTLYFQGRTNECDEMLDEWKAEGGGIHSMQDAGNILENEFAEKVFEKFDFDEGDHEWESEDEVNSD
jgi:tetratricopeptide (TPR) repeat protein